MNNEQMANLPHCPSAIEQFHPLKTRNVRNPAATTSPKSAFSPSSLVAEHGFHHRGSQASSALKLSRFQPMAQLSASRKD